MHQNSKLAGDIELRFLKNYYNDLLRDTDLTDRERDAIINKKKAIYEELRWK